MRRTRTLWMTVFLVACGILPVRAANLAVNLVTNGGFETGNFNSWVPSGNTDYTFVDVLPHSGSFTAWIGPAAEQDAKVTTFAKLLDDTRARPKSLPLRQADLQALNFKELFPANGGAPTAPQVVTELARRSKEGHRDADVVKFMIDREHYDQNGETPKIAMFRLYLQGPGVAVEKWSLSVRGRFETYTFGDVLDGVYLPVFRTELRKSLAPQPVGCKDLAVASLKQYLRGF